MNYYLIKKLWLRCFLLLILIVSEWLYISNLQSQLLESIKPKAVIKPIKIARINLDSHPAIDYADLVNRPLFIQGRRELSEQHIPQVSSSNEFNWSLSGIYKSKKDSWALLVRNSTEPEIIETTAKLGNYQRVTVDTEVDGWYISAIYADRIRLTRGDAEKELFLRKVKKISTNNK